MDDRLFRTIWLPKKLAKESGLIDNYQKDNEYFFVKPESAKETKDKIVIVFKFGSSEKTAKIRTISYDKKGLTPQKATFIGWIFVALYHDFFPDENYRKKAVKFLDIAVKHDGGSLSKNKASCLPYYILAENNLYDWDKDRMRFELYLASKCSDVFPDFFILLERFENNNIRKIGVQEEAIKLFPKDEHFICRIAENFFNNGDCQKCKEFILSKKEVIGDKLWAEYSCLHFIYLRTLINLKEYDEAEKLIMEIPSNYPLKEPTKMFFLGLINYENKKYARAVEYFSKSIQKDFSNSNETKASLYYMLLCFFEEKNIQKIEKTIQNLPLDQDNFEVFKLNYMETAEDALKEILTLQLNDLTKAKVLGLLAFISHKKLPEPGNAGIGRSLTQEEKNILNEGINLIKKALAFYPRDVFFNALYSNFLYLGKWYSDALICKLKTFGSQEKKSIFISYPYSYVSLEDCLDTFLDNYAKTIKELKESSYFLTSNYIGFDFNLDIGCLWRKKKYDSIAELYLYLKPDLDLFKIEDDNVSKGGGLFEIAYSLKESGNSKEAKHVYEEYIKIRGDTPSALNNLALIYEEEGQLKEAQKLIRQAKKINGDDEVVNNNYKRLISLEKKQKPDRTNKEQSDVTAPKALPSLDKANGKIFLGEKSCQIPLGSNQLELCMALFSKPLGEWVLETYVVPNFSRDVDSLRGFYDAIRAINQKAEKDLGVPRLIEYRASRARIRKEVFV